MAPKQRMNVANQQFNKNVNSRGNTPKSLVSAIQRFSTFRLQKPQSDKYPAAPWLIGLFVFVVCGSAIFEIVRQIKMF
ncbi:Ribosome associated membrane protein RAMP4 [Aphelenchoides besseyi]|nr:Ribosome associated membrane protein RAMP4 [Aphelenchoides besseyi]